MSGSHISTYIMLSVNVKATTKILSESNPNRADLNLFSNCILYGREPPPEQSLFNFLVVFSPLVHTCVGLVVRARPVQEKRKGHCMKGSRRVGTTFIYMYGGVMLNAVDLFRYFK